MAVTGYTCYATYDQLAQTLDDEEQRGIFWCAVNDFMFRGIDREDEMDNRFTKMAFIYAKSHLKHSLAQSERKQEKTKTKPNKTEQKPNRNRTKTKTKQGQVQGQVQGQECGGSFKPPTHAEIAEYCAEKGISIDIERFLDYFTAQGWRLANGNRMKDWRATVRTWHRRDSAPTKKEVPDEYRIYD